MQRWDERSRRLWGDGGADRLGGATVAVLGLGGVGGAAAEALCRAGVGRLVLVDFDTVELTNLNRQLVATADSVGQLKCEAARRRLLSICPQAEVIALPERYAPGSSDFLFEWRPDYVIDAIDMVTSKLHLLGACAGRGVPLITCLGTGNRLDPSQLRIGTLADTAGTGCPLARIMRRELRGTSHTRAQVLYSLEPPLSPLPPEQPEKLESGGRHSPASSPFVPPAAGLLLASHVVRALLGL